jgi:hypothetical protein
MIILGATVTFEPGIVATILGIISAFVSSVVAVTVFRLQTEYQIKESKEQIKLLRRDSKNSIIHIEGQLKDIQNFLHQATKDNPQIKTYYLRDNYSGHTGADFLKDE